MSAFNIKEDLTWHKVVVWAAIVIASVAVIVWAMPRDSRNSFSPELGKPWKYVDFRAPFDFPVYKSETTIKHERDSIIRLYEPYYVYHKDVEGRMVRSFVSDFSNGLPDLPEDFISIVANRLHRIYGLGVVNMIEDDNVEADTMRMIRLVDGKKATSVSASTLLTTKEAYEQLFADDVMGPHRQALQRCNLDKYITPNLIYDKERSTASRNDLLASIPLASGVVDTRQ